MSRARRTAIIVPVVLLASAIAAWLRFDGSPAYDDAAPPAAASPGAADTPTVPPPPAGVPVAVATSPVLSRLEQLADAGDGRAACELAYDLLSCAHRLAARDRSMLSLLAERERALEAEGDLEGANRIAGEQARLLATAGACQAIPARLRGRGGEYLRRAALSGEPVAMLAYAQGYQFNPSGRGWATDPTFEAWRVEAADMAHRALNAGNPWAAFVLSQAYRDDAGIPNSLVPDDPYRSAVYHLLWVRLYGSTEQAAWLAPLTADRQAAARREAERIHAGVFRGRTFDAASRRRSSPMHHRADSTAACEFGP